MKAIGGVRGNPASPQDTKTRKDAIAKMPRAKQLDNSLKGKTVIIMGNSSSLNKVDLRPLLRFPIIGCNRGLKPPTPITPTHLMVADRQPYCQERDAGRLSAFAAAGGIILGSDSLFDPSVLLRGPYEMIERRAQPTPKFKVYVYKIGTSGPRGPNTRIVCNRPILPLNYDTFGKALDSCLNISGSLIQAASILGAARIASIGIELSWPKTGDSHCFGPGRPVGAYPQKTSIPYTLACFEGARDKFKERGIEFFNLSPVKKCPFASVWGNYDYRTFVERFCKEE